MKDMLIDKIKEHSLEARKGREAVKANLLSTLYSEALMVGKNKRNGVPTDEEVMSTIQKFLKNANETKKMYESVNLKDTQPIDQVAEEISILSSYLPKMLSEESLTAAIKNMVFDAGLKNVGQVMAKLKENFPNQYDGKKASEIAKEQIQFYDEWVSDPNRGS